MARMTAQERRVRDALRKMQPAIRREFERAMTQAAGAVDLRAVVAALESGQIERALDLLRVNRAVLFPLQEAIRSSFMVGGQLMVADLPKGLVGSFGFNGNHPRALAWVAREGAELIQGIEDETIQASRAVITAGIEDGRSSAAVARDIVGRRVGRRRVGGFIGLTSERTDDIIRARRILSDPEQIRSYFVKDRKTGRMKPRYKLSDRRFDKQIRAAIKNGEAITGPQLDAIIEAHKSKALTARGRLIAKNESHVATAAGRDEAYRQALENPEVETVTIRWSHGLSVEPRLDHLRMDGTVIEMGETFPPMDDGAMMAHPHDPAGGIEHSANCRCVGIYRIRFRRD